jgi:hypothetical protein
VGDLDLDEPDLVRASGDEVEIVRPVRVDPDRVPFVLEIARDDPNQAPLGRAGNRATDRSRQGPLLRNQRSRREREIASRIGRPCGQA